MRRLALLLPVTAGLFGLVLTVAEAGETTAIPPIVSTLTPSELAAEQAESLTDNGSTYVRLHEDGSGDQLINGTTVRRFPAGTFAWDCSVMGNGLCGPGAHLPDTY